MVLVNLLAYGIMFIECEWARGSDIEDPDSHYLPPLVWFFSNPMAHHLIKNCAVLFLVLNYKLVTQMLVQTKQHQGGLAGYDRLNQQSVFGYQRRERDASKFMNILLKASVAVTFLAYLWITINSVVLIVEGIMYYEGDWKDKVCSTK